MPTISTTCAVTDALNSPVTTTHPKASTSQTLLWPLAAHASMQHPRALATAAGLAATQALSTAEAPTSNTTVCRSQQAAPGLAFKRAAKGGLEGRIVRIDSSKIRTSVIVTMPSTGGKAPVRYLMTTQAGGGPGGRIVSAAVPQKPFTVQHLLSGAATSNSSLRMSTVAASGQQYIRTADGKQHLLMVPAVHTSIQQIHVPRVVAPPRIISGPGTTTGCRVIRAKTMTVPRLNSLPAATSAQVIVRLTPQGIPVTWEMQVARGMPAVTRGTPLLIRSPASSSASQEATTTGKDRPPLSCIESLVANAGTATQLIGVNNKSPDYNGSSSHSDSGENDTGLQLTVNTNSKKSSDTPADNTSLKQGICLTRKRLSKTDDGDFENKVAKQL